MLLLNQVVDMGDTDFGRETRVDGAAAGACAIQLGAGVVRVDDVFGLHAQAFEVPVEERRIGVDIQNPGDPDAELAALLHECNALLGLRGLQPRFCGNRVGDVFRVRRAKHFLGGDVDVIGVLVSNRIEAGFDVLHVADVFHRALFTRGDDEPLLAKHQRNLGYLFDGHEVFYRFGAYVYKCAQAIIFAEVAARRFVARSTVFDPAHGFEPDKRGPLAVAPQAQRFLRGADGPGFPAVLMHDDFRLLAGRAEAVADEIYFGLHDREIILRTALQHEPRAERRKIGNARDVEEHVLRQHRGQPGKNFFR